MKAVVYRGPRQVAVEDVPDPKIERPTDAIVKITSTNICGSDLHMYEGRTDFEQGRIFGHENLGVVQEVGPAVERLKPGDWVALPFNISCGHCKNCERGLTAYCLKANQPGMAGGAFGFADMGPWPGGQAEYLRVPWADFMALKLPPDAEEKQADYVMCADIFPTGWHATELAGMKPGDAVVIYGAGPVGLMAAHSAMIKGACMVMVVDCHADRLKLAASIGAIPIDFTKGDPVQQVMDLTHGQGADVGCECVGYQCHDHHHHRQEVPNLTMNNLVNSVKFTGGIGVVGVFVPQDPGSPDALEKEGKIALDWGMLWFKGQRVGTGQCNVKAYNRQLRDLIHAGRAKPSFIVSHELKLEQAPDAYQHFDGRDHGWTKVILHPGS
jgi:threonine dehydrogenase-like Zn-dependent dehydrogenase